MKEAIAYLKQSHGEVRHNTGPVSRWNSKWPTHTTQPRSQGPLLLILLSPLRGTSRRETLAKKLYTTVILEALFMIYLLGIICVFSFFLHRLSSLLVRWSFHMLQPSLFQCVSSFPWYNWRSWFLKRNAEFWRQIIKGLCHENICWLHTRSEVNLK